MKNNEENEENEIQIEHRNYITEEGINVSDLPAEIKKAMRAFNEKLTKYESLEEEDLELFHQIQVDDVAIADAILTWYEDENSDDDDEHDIDDEEEQEEEHEEEEEEEQGQQQQENEKAAAEKAAAEKAAADKAAAEKAAEEEKQQQQQQQQQQQSAPKEESLEEKVMKSIKNNVISKSDLEEILGREADYPNETIGSITLRKQYLKPFYELK